jgi:hypothetical protein
MKDFKSQYSVDNIKRHESEYLNKKNWLLEQSKISYR